MSADQRTCLMCAQAEYEKILTADGPVTGVSVAGLRAVAGAKVWRVARCPRCGNVQISLVEGEVDQ